MILLKKLENSSPVYWYGQLFFFTDYKEKEWINLEESFQVQGTYVFVPNGFIPDGKFLQGVSGYMEKEKIQSSFLWIENPQDTNETWMTHKLKMITNNEGVKCFDKDAIILIGKYEFHFPNATVSCEEEEFIIKGEDNSFILNKGRSKISDKTVICAGYSECGKVQMEILVEGDSQKDAFSSLNAGVRFGICKEEGSGYQILNLECQVLESDKEISLWAEFYPCSPYDIEKTKFMLMNFPMESCLTTPEGKKIKMTPQSDACLVFEKQGTVNEKLEIEIQIYLGLSGRFQMEDGIDRILCGVSGTEYISLERSKERSILFIAHKEALIRMDEKDKWSDVATTAWIRFPDGIAYCSQPDSIPMYRVDPDDNFFLESMEIETSAYHGRSPEVPIAFYHSCSHDETIDQYEDLVCKKRNEILTDMLPLPVKPDIGEIVTGASPQGFTAGIDWKAGRWEWMSIGKTNNSSGNQVELILKRISNEASKKLQQKQVFLSYQDPQTFRQDFFTGDEASKDLSVYADGWGFALHPNKWRTQYDTTNTAVILKYNDTKSIREWMKGNEILQSSISRAYEMDKVTPRKEYQNFIRIIEDKGFTGVLFLNCPILIDALPEFLKIIVGDIPEEQLYAHHVAISSSKLEINNTMISQKQTSISVLIDYEGNNQIVTVQEPQVCDFTTLALKLTVFNSRVVLFSSTSELLINSFFGADCLRHDTQSGNCMVLDAFCHTDGDNITYDFSLRSPVEYGLENNPIETVLAETIGLSIGESGEQVFTVGGRLYTSPWEECDLFSYGREVGAERIKEDGIKFNGVGFLIPKSEPAFTEYQDVSLNNGGIQPRVQSFCNQFVCNLEGFCSDKEGSPDDMGYQAIKSPVMQSIIKGEWFGLVWKINLGTLGGLSEIEELNMYLITAWSGKGKDGYGGGVYFGARIPQMLTEEGINLQGIVKLGFQSVEIRMNKPTDMDREFELWLHNFNLKFIGISLIPGSNDIVVFLHKDKNGNKKLGWYAAYENEKAKVTERTMRNDA